MARADTPDNKVGFKKRAHRPWKHTLLEKAIRDTQVPSEDEETLVIEEKWVPPQAPLTENRSERQAVKTPVINTPSESELSFTSSPLTLGGFSKPIIARPSQNLETAYREKASAPKLDEPAQRKGSDHKLHFALLEQITSLEQEKEAVIDSVTDLKKQLQLVHVQLQEVERQKQTALNEKQATDDKLKSALEQFLTGESSRVSEVERQRQLVLNELLATEEKLKVNEAQLKVVHDQLLIKETDYIKLESIEKATSLQVEHEQSARIQSQSQVENLKKSLGESQARLNALMQALDKVNLEQEALQGQNSQLEANVYSLQLELDETDRRLLSEQQAKQLLTTELNDTTQKLEAAQLTIEGALNASNQAIAELAEIQTQLVKMQGVIATERNLRKLAEDKARFAIERAQQSELARQVEMTVRKRAEEKAESAMTETSKALMHILSSPSNRPK